MTNPQPKDSFSEVLDEVFDWLLADTMVLTTDQLEAKSTLTQIHNDLLVEAHQINHNIDVRYAPDLMTAFNRFIEKWCGDNYPHLIDSDDNDGQFIRHRIAQLKAQTKGENDD